MRRWLPIVLLLAAAGLAGLAWLRNSDRTEPIAAEPAPSPARPRPEPAAVEPSVQADPAPSRAALAPAGEPAAAPKPDASAAQLRVRVLGKTSRAPLARVRVMLTPKVVEGVGFSSQNSDGSNGDLGHSPITGADGLATLDLPPGRDFSLWAHGEDERSGQASAEVPALRAGEQRELVLEVADGIDGHIVGKVVCAETTEPVAGARVRLLHGGETRGEYRKPGPDAVTTGNDGLFELSFSLWENPRLCVEAEGYGLRYAALDGLHADAAHALVVNVSRAATLDARLLDAGGAPIAGAWVELSAKGYLLLWSESDERGFFSSGGSFSFPADEHWRSETGADGRARIGGLPAHVQLSAEVTKAGTQLVHEPSGLQFQPGEVKQVEWRVGGGATLRGLVLDQDAKPVARLEIWAARKRGALSTQFLQFERDHVDLRTRTDGEGRFTLRDLSAGNWSIGPAADEDSSVAPSTELVEIAGGAERDLTLNVYRGLYIRGRVLTPAGEPAQGVQIAGTGKPGEFFESGDVTANGEFRYGPLTPGTFQLYAFAFEKYSSSETVSASAGDSNVVLQLRLGGRIRGKVIDALSGAACTAQLVFMPEGRVAGQFANGMMTSTQPDGAFDRSGFEPGLWSVTATTADGRFAQHAHLEVAADSDSGDLVFELTPGGKLRIEYRGTKPQLYVTIQSNGAPISFPEWIKTGASIQHLAPAGALVLQIRSEQDGPARTKALELKAGETKDVVLTDED